MPAQSLLPIAYDYESSLKFYSFPAFRFIAALDNISPCASDRMWISSSESEPDQILFQPD